MRNWEFQQSSKAGFGGEVNPLKLLRRRSSLVVDDMALPSHHLNQGQQRPGVKGAAAPPPTMFEEPDASSLLDNFGF